MKKKAKDYLTLLAIVLIPVLVAAMIMGIPRQEQQEQAQEQGYSMTVAHSTMEGDASYSVTLYGPDGGAVLRLDASHVAGTVEEPGYSYGFTWLHREKPMITMEGAPSSESTEETAAREGYSVTVARNVAEGDVSYSATLYGPDGEAVLRLDVYRVAGTSGEPGYSYGFTWLHDVELEITEVWGQ